MARIAIPTINRRRRRSTPTDKLKSETTPNRFYYREAYIDAWNTLDADKLVSSVSDDFVFDDPAMPELVTKATLADYLVSIRKGWTLVLVQGCANEIDDASC